MPTVEKLINDISEIAANETLSFQERTKQIRAMMEAHWAARLPEQNGHILRDDIKETNFFPIEDYDNYIKKHGTLLVNAEWRCGWTILMLVAKTSAIYIACWLVHTQGALVNKCNDFGVTPLHAAIEAGQTEMAKTLIELGADINACVTNTASDVTTGDLSFGHTPLHFAIRYGRVDVVKYLIEQGANVEQEMQFVESPLKWAKEVYKHVLAIQNCEELEKTRKIFGGGYRDRSKVPSLESMDTIINILNAPSAKHSDSNNNGETKAINHSYLDKRKTEFMQAHTKHKNNQSFQFLRISGIGVDMSWSQIIEHAKGDSHKNKGLWFFNKYTGNRSQTTLQSMGVLDKQGNVVDNEIKKLIDADVGSARTVIPQ